jgi:hypothetical protein
VAYIFDPQIIAPSFSEAISQLTSITLIKLGIDVNSLPFWLSVVGYPLVMFEVFTRHIATAINILLRKAHNNTVELIRVLFQVFIMSSIIAAIGLVLIYHSEHVAKIPNISQEILTVTIKYTIVVAFFVTSILLISSLSLLAGQGNQVAGIGFILGTTGLVIEAIQNFGFTAEILLSITALFGAFLWHYGNKHNQAIELKGNKQEDLMDGIKRRRNHMRNL